MLLRILSIFTLALFRANFISAQFQFEWATQEHLYYNSNQCISAGPEGHIYISGALFGNYRVKSPNDRGGYIRCYNSEGTLVWHREFYDDKEVPTRHAVDKQGNLIVVGPGISKYNNLGILLNTIPSKKFTRYFGVAIDSQNNIVVGVETNYDSIPGGQSNAGRPLILKYSPQGLPLWIGELYNDKNLLNKGMDLAIDGQDNIIVIGAAPQSSTILKKFDKEGKVMWQYFYDDYLQLNPHSVAVGPSGAIYMTGDYERGDTTSREGFWFPHVELYSQAYIARFQPNGKLQWMIPGNSSLMVNNLDNFVDNAESLFVSGNYYVSSFSALPRSLEFGTLKFAASLDYMKNIFVLRFDSSGNSIHIVSTTVGTSCCPKITCHKNGLFISGNFGPDLRGNSYEMLDFRLEVESMCLLKLGYDMNNELSTAEESITQECFNLSPNPGSGHFILKRSSNHHEKATISVYNQTGTLVYRDQLAESCQETPMNISAPPGIYLIELRSVKTRATRKLVIQQ